MKLFEGNVGRLGGGGGSFICRNYICGIAKCDPKISAHMCSQALKPIKTLILIFNASS